MRHEPPRVWRRVVFRTTLVPHLRHMSVTIRIRCPTNDRRWCRHERCRRRAQVLADLVKTVAAAKGRKELVPRLASVPASVLTTLPEPASPYGLLSTRSSCPQSVRTVTESTVMVASPPAVLVVVNPASQTNEHCVVVSPGAPSQMIKKSNCAYANHCSLALVTQPVL